MGRFGRGKRGRIRAVFYQAGPDVIYLLTAYAKADREDLSWRLMRTAPVGRTVRHARCGTLPAWLAERPAPGALHTAHKGASLFEELPAGSPVRNEQSSLPVSGQGVLSSLVTQMPQYAADISESLPLRALILDFDGLIVDTESSSFELAHEVYSRHGVELTAELWRRCVGTHLDPYVHLQQVVGPGVDITAERDEQYVRHRRTTAMLDARAGVAELVAEAGAVGIRLGVASSSSHQWVDGHLERIGMLEAFATVRCRDDVQHTKPAPDVYLAVLDDLAASAGKP